MVNREKVINKVKAIVADMQEEVDEWKDYSDSELRGGLTCDCDWWYKTLQTLKNALTLLKAQEPRVMTIEDVKQFVYGTPYIIETNMAGAEPHLLYGLYSHQGVNGCFYFAFTDARSHFFDADYGKTWRCWTSRPDNATREAVKWE